MAGVSTKDIKNRIRSMESTRQITKAMEMVAASKLRHAQAQVLSSRPYFEILYATIQDILAHNNDVSSPYLTQRKGSKALYVVIAGDRGLAGGYNSNILKLVMAQCEGKDATILPIGKKAIEFFRARKMPMLSQNHPLTAEVSMGDCFSIAKVLSKAYLSGQFDQVYVAYTNFVSVLSQTPAVLQLLPLGGQQSTAEGGTDIIYEPNAVEVFDAIVPEYLGGALYGALCESVASEQAARRTAMDSATKNAEEMIGDLSLQYNRARQGAITQEITEIVAGS